MLICPECRSQMHDSDERCPECGLAQPESLSWAPWLVPLLCVFMLWLVGVLGYCVWESLFARPSPQEQARQAQIRQQFDERGQHVALRRWLEEQFPDARQLEVMATEYYDEEDYLLVLVFFWVMDGTDVRAHLAAARVSLTGEILEVRKRSW